MNYSEPLVNQINIFMKALGSGVIIALIYEAVSFVRLIFPGKRCVYIFFDSLFVIAASVFSFFFMVIYNSGQVRFNLMVAELAGGCAFHCALGRYFLSSAEKYIGIIKKITGRILTPFVTSGRKILSFFRRKTVSLFCRYKKEKIFEKNIKKIGNIRKIHLKNKNKSV